MSEPIIDESKVIIRPPQLYVWGVLVENEKHSKRLILVGKISIICGVIGTFGFVAMMSYFYCL